MTRFSKNNKHVCIDCYSNIQLKKRFIEERTNRNNGIK